MCLVSYLLGFVKKRGYILVLDDIKMKLVVDISFALVPQFSLYTRKMSIVLHEEYRVPHSQVVVPFGCSLLRNLCISLKSRIVNLCSDLSSRVLHRN